MTDATTPEQPSVTVTVAEEPEHSMDGWCWCQPRVEHITNLAGEDCEIIIHRRLWDQAEEDT